MQQGERRQSARESGRCKPYWNVPCIPILSKAFIMKGCWILSNAFSASNEMIMCCYISNFISDFINLDALSLPFEKVPWGAEKKQKDGSCFRIHSVSLCLFIGELSPLILREINVQVGKVFFNDFVEYVFHAFELVFFSFFYSYYSYVGSFHGVPDFLDILFYDLFGFGVFLDCRIYFLYCLFKHLHEAFLKVIFFCFISIDQILVLVGGYILVFSCSL
ncbi:hypothetical protein STEG23_003914 [Scotinomys teguina]